MALSFGVTSTGGYGVLQSVNTTSSAEIADARNAVGKVTDQHAYSKTNEVSAEALFTGETLAEAGAELTVGGLAGLITNISKSESNTDFQRVSVTVQKKDAATLSAYS